MIGIRVVGVALAVQLAVAGHLASQQRATITQAGRDRASLAASFQQSFREEGCSTCRTWVSGPDNTTVKILDPQATTTPNDYNGRPVFWYDAGFTKVIYYSAPGVVYAQHELASDPPPTWTQAQRDSIRREACRALNRQEGTNHPCH